jgi:hypothetical protein
MYQYNGAKISEGPTIDLLVRAIERHVHKAGDHVTALPAFSFLGEQRRQLALLLQRVANKERLMKGVHPGYGRSLPRQYVKHPRRPQ